MSLTAETLGIRYGSTGTGCLYDGATLALAETMVRSYVRSVGCPESDDEPWPDLAAVIHLIAHRLHGEDFTRARESAEVAGDYREASFRPFRGFSPAERLMLDRYRQRLM